jgi:UDPglucose--hexose-1-phosphate uridylyltransferase
VVELRRDPLSKNWIVTGYKSEKTDRPGMCPFCPGNEHLTPRSIKEIRDEDGSWLVRCFPSRKPLFEIEAAENKRAEGMYDKMGNVGAHEIIVDGRHHSKTIANFTQKELLSLLYMYADRISDLKRDKRFRYVQVFKNFGELAGSYLLHPHSHVLASPILPFRIEQEMESARSHFALKERCLFCDIIAQEIRQMKRVVSLTQEFVAFCPFASRFPYEVWILPRSHRERFETIMEEGKDVEFAQLFLDIMDRIERHVSSYTFVIHTSPNIAHPSVKETFEDMHEYFHWHIEIMPRDFRSSKYKREDEFYVVEITPEEAALSLKGT